MADKKITALTEKTVPAITDLVAIVDMVAGQTKKAYIGNLPQAAHKTTHENGGGDEMSVSGLSGLLADAQTPLTHKTSHQDGGSDEISVAGLSGLLADKQDALKIQGHAVTETALGNNKILVYKTSGDQFVYEDKGTPAGHHTTHEVGGGDVISVNGLSGVLVDKQDADYIQGKPVDMTGISNDKVIVYKLSGDKFVLESKSVPAAHGASHEFGSGDPIDVTGLTGAGAPTGLHYASQIPGVVLDCNIYTGDKIGGGTPTDNTTAINALLATATAENPIILIINGGAAIKTLVIPDTGYVSIIGLGLSTGFFVMDATDGDFVRTTTHPWTPGAPESIAGYNVHFRDFFVNVNRPGNSTTGDLRGVVSGSVYWYTGFHIHAIQNLTFEGIHIYDCPTFGTNLYGCKRIRINGCQVESPGRSVNTDGFHFNGGCDDVIVDGVRLACGDDGIAINVDEGDAVAGNNFILNNVILDDCYGALRIYGKATATKNILATNFVGTVRSYKVAYGLEAHPPGPLSDCNHSVTLSGWDVHWSGAITPTGDIILTGSGGSLVLDNYQVNSPTYAVPIIYGVNGEFDTCTLSSLAINNSQIYRDAIGNAAANLMYLPSGTIKNMNVTNFRVLSKVASTYSVISVLISVQGSGVVSKLFLRGIHVDDVTAIYVAASGGTISSVNTGIKIGVLVKDTADVSGDTGYTGIGFKPSRVQFIATVDSTPQTSSGMDDKTTQMCITNHPTVNWVIDATHSMALYQTAAIYYMGLVKSFDADGFTITWAKTGAKVGYATIMYTAYE
jgi:hypothetical protein